MFRRGVVLCMLMVLAGCGGADEESGAPPPDDASVMDTATPTATPADTSDTSDGSYREVEFTGDDGETRTGYLFGDAGAEVAVVLSHMGSNGDSPQDWAATAEVLADQGYAVLTYDRIRPRYQVWEDLIGAVRYLRDDAGSETVIVGGASLGAMASLHVALAGDPEVDAVIWVAGVLSNNGMHFDQETVSGLACPAFVASGADDGYGAAADAEALAGWIPSAGEPLILPTSAHGTNILAEGGTAAADLEAAIVEFVATVAGQPRTPC